MEMLVSTARVWNTWHQTPTRAGIETKTSVLANVSTMLLPLYPKVTLGQNNYQIDKYLYIIFNQTFFMVGWLVEETPKY